MSASMAVPYIIIQPKQPLDNKCPFNHGKFITIGTALEMYSFLYKATVIGHFYNINIH